MSLPVVSAVAPFRPRMAAVRILLLILLLFGGVCVAAQSNPEVFDSLQKRLVDSGFDKDEIHTLYVKHPVKFDAKSVSGFFSHQEGALDYDQFTRQAQIRAARAYITANKLLLARMENDFGVDPEVVTAILLVETRLGTYVGNRNILDVLSTMAALKEPWVLETLWKNIPAAKRLPRSAFEEKARKKSEWAFEELKALLTYAEREHLNPVMILGSYAGAMGIAQFMPSSALLLARDGDQNGRINLFDHPDAIVSVANYLKHYGWKPGMDREKAAEVIWQYNHSKYYVSAVLKIADLLKG